jgi:predicted lipid-binding transport protein (Tim44 family)
MHDGFDPTTIIFAVLAIFVVWKLKSVLGTRVDIEKRPPSGPAPSPIDASDGKVVRLPGAAGQPMAGRPNASSPGLDKFAKSDRGRAGLKALIAADPSFDPARFLAGAKAAYEMIIGAFASGDRKTLGDLLSPEVLASFAAVIDQRESAGELASTKLVSIDSLEVVDALVKDSLAQVSLRISAKMINTVRDSSGVVVSGDAETVVSTDDLWTFARPIGSRDPTWRLIATESEHQA